MSDRDTLETVDPVVGQLYINFLPASPTQSAFVDIFFDDNLILQDKAYDGSSKPPTRNNCIGNPQQLLSIESSESLLEETGLSLEVLFDDVNSAAMMDKNDRGSQNDGAVFHGNGGAIMEYHNSKGDLDPSALTLATFEVVNNKRKCSAPSEQISAMTNFNSSSNPSQNTQISTSSSSALTKVTINKDVTEQKQDKKKKKTIRSGQYVPFNATAMGTATKPETNSKPDYLSFWPLLSSLYNESNERDIHLLLTTHCSDECRLRVCKRLPRRSTSTEKEEEEEEEEEEEVPLFEDTHIGIENVHRFWSNLLKQVPGGLFKTLMQPCKDIKSELESTGVKLKLVYQYMYSGQVVLMNAEGTAHVDVMRYQTPGMLTLTIDRSEDLIVDIYFAYKI